MATSSSRLPNSPRRAGSSDAVGVHQQQPGIGRERAGNRDALGFPARQRTWQRVFTVPHTQLRQQLASAPGPATAGRGRRAPAPGRCSRPPTSVPRGNGTGTPCPPCGAARRAKTRGAPARDRLRRCGRHQTARAGDGAQDGRLAGPREALGATSSPRATCRSTPRRIPRELREPKPFHLEHEGRHGVGTAQRRSSRPASRASGHDMARYMPAQSGGPPRPDSGATRHGVIRRGALNANDSTRRP